MSRQQQSAASQAAGQKRKTAAATGASFFCNDKRAKAPCPGAQGACSIVVLSDDNDAAAADTAGSHPAQLPRPATSPTAAAHIHGGGNFGGGGGRTVLEDGSSHANGGVSDTADGRKADVKGGGRPPPGQPQPRERTSAELNKGVRPHPPP